MDSNQGSHGLATLSCWIGDEAGQEVWWIHIRGAMDWQLCLVDVGMKLDWKSGGLVLGKQHGNGEEKDSRKGGDFRKRREGNCNFLSLGSTCEMLWEF